VRQYHQPTAPSFNLDFGRELLSVKGFASRGLVLYERRVPWKLIYYEAYAERADAEGRERYLKSGGGRRFVRRQLRLSQEISRFVSRRGGPFSTFSRVRPKAFYAGYPAWIRTKNNASKGRCVTVTPRGISMCDFRSAIFD
jgi:hypothetical protein